MQQHTGIWRFTKDLDIFLTSASMMVAMEALSRREFVCEVCDPVWLAKARRGFFFVDLITGMSNGTIKVEDSWIERSRPAWIVGAPTLVLPPEELLASKLFVTRRERFDGADIAHIIYASRGMLDWARILSLIGEHWEMLLWALVFFRYVYPAHGGFVPLELWRDLLTRYAQLISAPQPHARFRGTLIDDNMFAIDVKEWGMDNVQAEYRANLLAPADTRLAVLSDEAGRGEG
jgi:hypothetical protein